MNAKTVVLGLAVALGASSMATGGDIGFLENFALAKDRTAPLRQLIPGTEDYYYFHALHFLNTGQFDKAEALARPWHERFGQTARLTEIQTRFALLTFDRDPKRTLDYLKGRLGLTFAHQREILGAAPNLPTALDPTLIARERLRADAFARWPHNLDNFEDAALDGLATVDLGWERRRSLLQRLRRPDLANLPTLVDEDLKAQHAQPFGSYPIHGQMTLAQLDQLLKLRPDLLNQDAFVRAWAAKLQPGADEDFRRDPKATQAYLDRLEGFVNRLSPAHNTLKAHGLFHRLAFDRSRGAYDRGRFLAYLALPRQQPYMARAWLQREESRRWPADLNADFGPVTLLPPVRNDEELVRSYLLHFLATADNAKDFEPFIDDVYLRHAFIESKIVQGQGDPEDWASQLPPEEFRRLKERIDIDFAPTNKTDYAADEPVKLELSVKNVPTMLVKVFEINTPSFYRLHQREVDTDVNLDGLVANSEKRHAYAEPPLLRVARSYEFPELSKPGVYVVDFIGAGKSSRALIRKGRLRPLVTTGTAGQVVRVVDEANRPVIDATLSLGGQEYRADKDGAIIVPFSTSPGVRPVVLRKGDFACLDVIPHPAESYALTAGIHVDRESLLTSRVAPVLIRPHLTLNGRPVSVKLLEEVKLRITSTDHGNIPTSVEVPQFKLFEDRESVHEVRVPPRLATLTVALSARVKSLTTGKPVDVSTSKAFALNEIDRTDKIEDLHLAKFGPDYVIEVLGRTGEARADRPVQLALKHREFKEPVQATLKSDVAGRVRLGELGDIVTVTATGPEGTAHTWALADDHATYRQVLDAKVGDTVKVPAPAGVGQPSRAELALFEVRGDLVRADRFEALAVKDGMVELRGLAAGDYDLHLKRPGERIRVRVVDGVARDGFVLGRARFLRLAELPPVQIAGVAAEGDALTVRLTDASPFARVHLFATRYRPAFDPFANLGAVRDVELDGVVPGTADSVYLTGRNIGDEYRYVLDRQGLKKFPGSMLERPQLLLNPWAVRSTETAEQLAQGGDFFGVTGGVKPSETAKAPGASPKPSAPTGPGGDFADLDFLADASAVHFNLVPDKDGVVKVRRDKLGPHAWVHVVIVDPTQTVARSVALPETPAKFIDLRLAKGLDPARHFTQQKQVSLLTAGQPFTLADVGGSRFEHYDSLARVYALYSTLSKDPTLAEFSFLLTWPKLKPEEKRALYSKYACHELSFFLSRKDPEFFRDVVRPYLANKKDKTFLDRWLLEDNLSSCLQPWEYGRLNTVERVLLAQRLAGESAKTARALDERLRLTPPNLDRLLVLFDTAVTGSGLDSEGALGKVRAGLQIESKRYLKEELSLERNGIEEKAAKSVSEAARAPDAGAGLAAGRPPSAEPANANRPASAASDVKDLETDQREGRSSGRWGKDAAKLADEPESGKRGGLLRSDDRTRLGREFRPLYRRQDPTMEWAENNYYHLPIARQLAELVPPGDFWLDFARHDPHQPFLSRHLADASRNFTEILCALAVLDLPFEAPAPAMKFDGGSMTLTPAGPGIAFHEEVRPADAAPPLPILVSQNFYRHGDRFREDNGEKVDKFVTGEFVIQTAYGCQVVVTNPTSFRQKLTALLQVPEGAIPLAGAQFTRSVPLDLEPYRTATLDTLFYFPAPGHFRHFPVNIAKNEKYVASAPAAVFDVVAKPTKIDTTSWEYVSQNGSTEEVLAFLGRENVLALNLDKIAFRMRDRGIFESVTRLLQDRHVYSPTLWSYGLYHADLPTARQFLLHADSLVNDCGGPIASTVLTIDPVARHQYEHLEYRPLVNARAHALGPRRQIVNDRFHEQYHRFLKVLSYHPELDDADRLAVAYYLFLQDRVEEGLAFFEGVSPERLPTRMQYDYCAAVADLYREDLPRARARAQKYAAHPVDRWRTAFAAILGQLDEAEGKDNPVLDPENREQRQSQLAATEPSFELASDDARGRGIRLTWQNLESVTVSYYLMDVELLFSRNPFVQQSAEQFASIRPNARKEVKLAAKKGEQTIPLPEEFATRNVLVQVTAGGKTRSLPSYASAMTVQMLENYGQVRVTAADKPVPKAYVKVYARMAGGAVKFYKDGYTDLRGRFDYASLSTPERQAVERFSILVLSEDRGATIRATAPPAQ